MKASKLLMDLPWYHNVIKIMEGNRIFNQNDPCCIYKILHSIL